LSFAHHAACANTCSLRTYASLHEHVAVLGVVIKMWAKQRAVSGVVASNQFLSSYSITLLLIYSLQVKVALTPSLQAPALVQHDETQSFCTDVGLPVGSNQPPPYTARWVAVRFDR
jgi:DNA polymerase sigma